MLLHLSLVSCMSSYCLQFFFNSTGLAFWKSTTRKVYAIASQSVEGKDDVVIFKEDEESSAPKVSPGMYM